MRDRRERPTIKSSNATLDGPNEAGEFAGIAVTNRSSRSPPAVRRSRNDDARTEVCPKVAYRVTSAPHTAWSCVICPKLRAWSRSAVTQEHMIQHRDTYKCVRGLWLWVSRGQDARSALLMQGKASVNAERHQGSSVRCHKGRGVGAEAWSDRGKHRATFL